MAAIIVNAPRHCFSTNLGTLDSWSYKTGPKIICGDEDGDHEDQFTMRMWRLFPDICREFPDLSATVYDVENFFDEYDQTVYGVEYLRCVLSRIASINSQCLSEGRAIAREWIVENIRLFLSVAGRTVRAQEMLRRPRTESYEDVYIDRALQSVWEIRCGLEALIFTDAWVDAHQKQFLDITTRPRREDVFTQREIELYNELFLDRVVQAIWSRRCGE